MAALGLDRQRSSQCVEPEYRIGAGHERHGGDRGFRYQIPVDGITEGFVHTHAVDVHRQAFGRTEQWRGGEAVVIDVQLKRVVSALAYVHATEVIVEIIAPPQGLLS